MAEDRGTKRNKEMPEWNNKRDGTRDRKQEKMALQGIDDAKTNQSTYRAKNVPYLTNSGQM